MRIEELKFFRPDEIGRESHKLPAELYNQSRLLLNRTELNCQFVPIRSMQYQAVITDMEIIFVDSLGYAVLDGEGGRLIVIAWQFPKHQPRENLNSPVAMDLVYYHPDYNELQRRLLGEFNRAMKEMLSRQRVAETPGQCLKVIPISAFQS
jgi:hypothetical protein